MDKKSILIAGDYHTYGAFDTLIKANPSHNVFTDAFEQLCQSSDLSIFNLEDPITDNRNGILKHGPHGVGSPLSIKPLAKAGFKLATFATNHTYDMGDSGITDTLEVCKSNGIDVMGGGLTREEAAAIYYKKIGGFKMAFLNFSRIEYNIVTDEHGGANPLDTVQNSRDIYEAKKNADLVIVMVHEGVDVFELPYPKLVDQMRFYVEMGADAIVLHHSRIISGYEIYKEAPIFYGIGNLLHMSVNPDEHQGLMIELILSANTIDFKIHPVVLDSKAALVSLAEGERKANMLKRVNELSAIIVDDAELKKHWTRFITLKTGQYLNIVAGYPSILYRFAKKSKLLPIYKKILMRKRSKYLSVGNIARCQTHNEAFQMIVDNIQNGSLK